MDNLKLHHKPIKRFGLEGTIYDSAHIDRLKTEYLSLIVLQMRERGYVPRLDIDYDFTLFYNQDNNDYSFKMSVYGIYLGARKAQKVKAVSDYRAIYEKTDIQEHRSRVQAQGD